MALIVRRDIINFIVSKGDEPFRYVTLTKGQEVDLDAIVKAFGDGDGDDDLKKRLERQLAKLKGTGGVVDSGNGTLADLAKAKQEEAAGESKPPEEKKETSSSSTPPAASTSSKPSTGS
jgi:uncharacterized protein YdaU (DUF1376 family)